MQPQASLQGAEVQVTHPSEEELAGSSAPGSGAGPEIERQTTRVVVFEGQLLHWTLSLSNTGEPYSQGL